VIFFWGRTRATVGVLKNSATDRCARGARSCCLCEVGVIELVIELANRACRDRRARRRRTEYGPTDGLREAVAEGSR